MAVLTLFSWGAEKNDLSGNAMAFHHLSCCDGTKNGCCRDEIVATRMTNIRKAIWKVSFLK